MCVKLLESVSRCTPFAVTPTLPHKIFLLFFSVPLVLYNTSAHD